MPEQAVVSPRPARTPQRQRVLATRALPLTRRMQRGTTNHDEQLAVVGVGHWHPGHEPQASLVSPVSLAYQLSSVAAVPVNGA